jgi:hypothetical protein
MNRACDFNPDRAFPQLCYLHREASPHFNTPFQVKRPLLALATYRVRLRNRGIAPPRRSSPRTGLRGRLVPDRATGTLPSTIAHALRENVWMDLRDLDDWLARGGTATVPDPYCRILIEVNANLDSFVKWPQRPELLWDGCVKVDKHQFPDAIKTAVQAAGLGLRNWSNDPAIYAYRLAEGERPRQANRGEWNIHHIYDGQFPYPGNPRPSLHAVKHPRHFTQSAGLVAVHSIAHALANEFAVFAWRLRAEAFLRFGYDPEGVFSEAQDEFGFVGRGPVKVWVTCAG